MANSHLDLELGNHATFGVVRHTAAEQEASSQVILVVPFKDIFVGQESEEDDGFLKCDFNFRIGFLQVRRVTAGTHILGSLF